jgi:putative endonuclease
MTSLQRDYYVYMLASLSGVLYVGVTNNLECRLYEHRNGTADGFTKRYRCHRLVWFETTGDVNAAIAREKQIKGWRRSKKEDLIREMNPSWADLAQAF